MLRNKRGNNKSYADQRNDQSKRIKIGKKQERSKNIKFSTTMKEYREWRKLDENGHISSDFFMVETKILRLL